MKIQSWMIKSWESVECYLPPSPDKIPNFKHASTQVRDDGSSSGMRAGDTVWVAQDEDWIAGLAWEWVEARPGVLMLADPNSIVTNLSVVDQDRRLMTNLKKTVAINRLLHGLAWQTQVRNLFECRPQVLPSAGLRRLQPALSPHWVSTLFNSTAGRSSQPLSAAAPNRQIEHTKTLSARSKTGQAAAQGGPHSAARIPRSRASDLDQDAADALSTAQLRRAA